MAPASVGKLTGLPHFLVEPHFSEWDHDASQGFDPGEFSSLGVNRDLIRRAPDDPRGLAGANERAVSFHGFRKPLNVRNRIRPLASGIIGNQLGVIVSHGMTLAKRMPKGNHKKARPTH